MVALAQGMVAPAPAGGPLYARALIAPAIGSAGNTQAPAIRAARRAKISWPGGRGCHTRPRRTGRSAVQRPPWPVPLYKNPRRHWPRTAGAPARPLARDGNSSLSRRAGRGRSGSVSPAPSGPRRVHRARCGHRRHHARATGRRPIRRRWRRYWQCAAGRPPGGRRMPCATDARGKCAPRSAGAHRRRGQVTGSCWLQSVLGKCRSVHTWNRYRGACPVFTCINALPRKAGVFSVPD